VKSPAKWPRWWRYRSDEGRGFDLKKIRNPLEEKNLMRESGRGIFLMRTLMDKVEYVAEGGGVQVELWMDLKNSRQ
jgi:serine/threonine-protein kinase RsbW